MLTFGALRAQERQLPILQTEPATPALQIVAPMSYSTLWLEESVDPILQKRRQIHQMMEQQAQQSVLLRPSIPQSEQANKVSGLWRMTFGNTSANNWSPFPDRALDARTLRFPLPRNMQPDKRPESVQRLEKLKK